MKSLLASLCCLLLLSGCQSSPADEIQLSPLFSDHMVLQRDTNIKIWGKATPNGRVTVTLNQQRAEITADEDSSWVVNLAPEPAGGPFELRVAGRDEQTINDVLIGEVWLASGQSNMEWPMQASNNAEQEIAAANDSEIRLFTVRKSVAGTPSNTIPSEGWKITNPENIASFSAVAYYFARVLRDSLNVPIGLIHSSWGGTPAEAWTSGNSLLRHPDYVEAVQKLQNNPEAFDPTASLDAWFTAVDEQDAGLSSNTAPWSSANTPTDSWQTMNAPGLWEDTELPNFDGVVWFQKTIEIPEDWVSAPLLLGLAQIDDIDQTWINGIEIGNTDQYNLLRRYEIPASTFETGVLSITVRVIDTGGGGGFWGDAAGMLIMPADSSSAPLSLAGTWKYKVGVDFDDADLPVRPGGLQHTPSVLYNAMIHPLIPVALKGAIWYQGESNASRAHQYQTLFPLMIEDWREQWDQTLAFHFVQLANFMEEQKRAVEQETWPELREAQTMALSLPSTGMAVTIDIGEADDIHPRNKHDVGRRLALSALNKTYGHNTMPGGPLYQSFEVEGNQIRIKFANADNGFMTPGNERIRGFAIAGEDQIFHWATALVDSSDILLSSARVPNPVAARYGWANNPVLNLYNAEQLPASPFRTDDWPGITEGVK